MSDWSRSVVNHTFAQQYRVSHLLCEGGMGAIFQGMHVETGMPVAIKVILPEAAESVNLVRFEREIACTKQAACPAIVEVFATGTDPMFGPFLVMEHLYGENLSARIQRRGLISIEESLRVARWVLLALHVAHSHQIIHRDITPSNIFFRYDQMGHETIKLLDFGVSRLISGENCKPLTAMGDAIGTPRYMSPEQARAEPLDHRSDLYSLGSILYSCLAGESAYPYAHPIRILLAVGSSPPVPLRESCPHLPGNVSWLVDKAMSFDRNQRFPDAQSMSQAVDEVWFSLVHQETSQGTPLATQHLPPHIRSSYPPPASGNNRS
jgi:eukaryotic-like serine/threonine-protein kinase